MAENSKKSLDPLKPVKINSDSDRKIPAAINTPRPYKKNKSDTKSSTHFNIDSKITPVPISTRKAEAEANREVDRTPKAISKHSPTENESDSGNFFNTLPKIDIIESGQPISEDRIPIDTNQTPKSQPGFMNNPSKDETDPSPSFVPEQLKEKFEDYKRISSESNQKPDFSKSSPEAAAKVPSEIQPEPEPVESEQSSTSEVSFPVNKRRQNSADTNREQTGTIFKHNDQRRQELANLLWGEREDRFQTDFEKDETDPGMPADTAVSLQELRDKEKKPESTPRKIVQKLHPKPEGSVKVSDKNEDETFVGTKEVPQRFPVARNHQEPFKSRRFQRRECSFPGILTVLVPTDTFQPVKLAVRVVDISPLGARLETKQLDDSMTEMLKSDNWFCRLEMLVPHRDKIRCTSRITWVKHDENESELGIQFEEVNQDVDSIFAEGVGQESKIESIALRSPIIDQFSSVTPSAEFTFTGICHDCDRLVVTRGLKQFETIPIGGRFSITIPLSNNRTNFLSFMCVRGDQQSVPTPAVILQKIGAEDSVSVHGGSLIEDFLLSPDGKRLQVSMQGPPARFFRALKRIEESLQFADDIFLSIDFRGNAKKAAERLETLKDEK